MNNHPLATAIATDVADRAWDRLAGRLADETRMRGLLPGGVVEDDGRDEVVGRYADWYDRFETVVVEDIEGDLVGDRVLVHYKLVVDPDGDRRVVSQTLVCSVHDDRVTRIDLVCSGLRKC
jgi:hypothetical protein